MKKDAIEEFLEEVLEEVDSDDSEYDLPREPKILRCLIANDEWIQLEILKYMFEKSEMQVTTAINGYEAFEILNKSKEEEAEKFDLVILDLNMPISDGYETCRNIIKLFSSL